MRDSADICHPCRSRQLYQRSSRTDENAGQALHASGFQWEILPYREACVFGILRSGTHGGATGQTVAQGPTPNILLIASKSMSLLSSKETLTVDGAYPHDVHENIEASKMPPEKTSNNLREKNKKLRPLLMLHWAKADLFPNRTIWFGLWPRLTMVSNLRSSWC